MTRRCIHRSLRSKGSFIVTGGSIGLYSFIEQPVLFTGGAQYMYDSFFDLGHRSRRNWDRGQFRKCRLADPTVINSPIGKYQGAYTTSVLAINRFMLVADGRYDNVILAIADTAAHARTTIGTMVGTITSAGQEASHVAYGQIGYCCLDLTGGHSELRRLERHSTFHRRVRATRRRTDPCPAVAQMLASRLKPSNGTGVVRGCSAAPASGQRTTSSS